MMVSPAFKAIIACIMLPVVAARINYPATFAELADRNLQELVSGCHDCSCFTCDDVEQLADGSLEVTVRHCKDGSIGWMCCVGVDGEEGNCEISPGTCTGSLQGAKCNTVNRYLRFLSHPPLKPLPSILMMVKLREMPTMSSQFVEELETNRVVARKATLLPTASRNSIWLQIVAIIKAPQQHLLPLLLRYQRKPLRYQRQLQVVPVETL
jgi:hypothetical protein